MPSPHKKIPESRSRDHRSRPRDSRVIGAGIVTRCTTGFCEPPHKWKIRPDPVIGRRIHFPAPSLSISVKMSAGFGRSPNVVPRFSYRITPPVSITNVAGRFDHSV